jgi:uncharacterized membrane protein YgcG
VELSPKLSFKVEGSNKNKEFRLFAVVCFTGIDDNGHYWAHVRHQDEWWELNDAKPAKRSVPSGCKAKLLFYELDEPSANNGSSTSSGVSGICDGGISGGGGSGGGGGGGSGSIWWWRWWQNSKWRS